MAQLEAGLLSLIQAWMSGRGNPTPDAIQCCADSIAPSGRASIEIDRPAHLRTSKMRNIWAIPSAAS